MAEDATAPSELGDRLLAAPRLCEGVRRRKSARAHLVNSDPSGLRSESLSAGLRWALYRLPQEARRGPQLAELHAGVDPEAQVVAADAGHELAQLSVLSKSSMLWLSNGGRCTERSWMCVSALVVVLALSIMERER